MVPAGQQTTVFEDPRPLHVSDVSGDERYILFEQSYGQIPTTTLLLQLTDGAKPRPLTDYVSGAHYARFSPDSISWLMRLSRPAAMNYTPLRCYKAANSSLPVPGAG